MDPANQATWKPTAFEVELTQACDRYCDYCFLGEPGGGDMTKETAAMVVEAANWSKGTDLLARPEVTLHGGEPFLNWDIVVYLAERLSSFCGMAIMTHGAIGKEPQFAFLREHGVEVKRSCAGSPASSEITRPGKYSDNWLRVGEFVQDYAATHRITVTPKTAGNLCEDLRWRHRNGYYGAVDFRTDDYDRWKPVAIETYTDQFERLAREFIRQYRRGTPMCIEVLQAFGRARYAQGGVMVMGCSAAWNTWGVTWDGFVMPCVPPDTLVATPSGFAPICDLQEGDSVIGHSGISRAITGVSKRWYEGDMVSIGVCGTNERQDFTPEHPVYVLRSDKCCSGRRGRRCRPNCATRCRPWDSTTQPEWIPAKEVRKHDYVLYPVSQQEVSIGCLTVADTTDIGNAIKIETSVSVNINEDAMLWFGWYLAEGCCRRAGAISFNLNADEQADAEWLKSTGKRLFGVNFAIYRKGEHGLVVQGCSTRLALWLASVFGRGAANKRLPPEFMVLPASQQLPLLRGMYYGDGGQDRGRSAFLSTTSRVLAYQTKTLLLRQDVLPGIRRYYATRHEDRINRRDEWRVYVQSREACNRLFGDRWKFAASTKEQPQQGWIADGYSFRPVHSVDIRSYKGFVHNIEVQDDHSYTLASLIAHNCHRFFRASKRPGYLSGGKLRDLLDGKSLSFGPGIQEAVNGWSVGREWEMCLPCPARQSCARGCLHVNLAMGHRPDAPPPAHWCEFQRLYYRLSAEIQQALEGDAWWDAKPVAVCDFPQE